MRRAVMALAVVVVALAAATTTAVPTEAKPPRPSTVRMPTGGYVDPTTGTNWGAPIWAEDFTTDVPPGAAWDTDYGDQTFPTTNPYRTRFGAYPRRVWSNTTGGFVPFWDTHGSSNYNTRETMWTQGGRLHIRNKVVPLDINGGKLTPVGATLIPRLGPNYYSQFLRTEVSETVLPGQSGYFGKVWLFINSNKWPSDGEFDFPEGSFNDEVFGYLHRASPTPNQQKYQPTNPRLDYNNRLTTVMQWEPAANGVDHRLRVWMNGQLLFDESGPQIGVGSMPKVFLLQTGTTSPWDDTFTASQAGTSAELAIDYVVVWKHPRGTV